MRVEFFATLRSLTDENSFEISPPVDLRALFHIFNQRYGKKFTSLLLDDSGCLNQGIIILVNGRNVHFLNNLDTLLEKEDTVSIFPPLGGG
jgi:sulfur-carrier protein